MKKILFFCLLGAVFSLSANAQVLVAEDFEGGALPSGWAIQTNASDGGWNFGAGPDLASQYWPLPDNGSIVAATNDDACNCDKSADYLILPAVDVTGLDALTLQFDMSFAGGTYQGSTEQAFIEYSTDGGSTWTQLIEIAGTGEVAWVPQTLDLSSLTSNTGEVLIAFRYNDAGNWLYGFAVDNVQLFTPVDLDAGFTLDAVDPYAMVNDAITISGTITNHGLQMLHSVDVSWSDGSNTYTDNLTGLSLAPGASMSFTHSAAFNVPSAEGHTISVWVENPNGGTDGIETNDGGEFVVYGLSFMPEKKVFAEEATGTWCGWCPRGAVFMEYMAENYEDTYVGIAVHNGDPMAFSTYDNGLTSFPGFSGFPSVVFERDVIIDPSELEAYYNQYITKPTAVAVDATVATLDVATRELDVNADLTFATSLAANQYNMAIILKEDGVTGTGSGYAQVNYYSGGSNGSMGGYENLPDPVPASQMVYDDVARAIVPSFEGDAGDAISAGDVFSIGMLYDFPDNWDPRQMQVAFLVTDQNGRALNTAAMDITVVCPDNLGLNILVNDVSQAGATDGSVIVDPSLGIAPFTYTLDGVTVNSTISNLSTGLYELVVADNAGCVDSVTIEVVTVGVKDIEGLQKFALLPNPATDRTVLDLEFDHSVDLIVEVSDLTGRLVYSRHIGQTNGGQYELDLADQAEGMYLVRLKVENQTRTQRLILMH